MRETAIDYKHAAINAFMTEYFCENNNRFLGKHREMAEKALFGNSTWYKMREQIKDLKQDYLNELSDPKLPFSIQKAAKKLHEAVMQNLDLDELERRYNRAMKEHLKKE